ncbi:MAG: aminotransferase class I/II-fold pyridoxal phosphate-dependent enzyme [Chitinophagaceae bacterium]|nr:MAG: aminotransferase class I/II-fold pyridoxal phosphate-dependent enzyme [Chitinophagaceae bacterium]
MNPGIPFKGFGSLAVHSGHQADGNYAHLSPIYATSTFVYDDAEQGMRRFSGQEQGFIYSRWGNPTFIEAEQKIAAMEAYGIKNAKGEAMQLAALLHASGMAAITTLFLLNLKSGDKILTHYSLYGGTEEVLRNVLPALGIDCIITDLRDTTKAEAALKNDPSIRMLYLETPANPTIQCVDIETLSNIAKQHHCIVACDNTFATPYLQQPFRYNVDFTVHSTTKFLNGHGTAIGGVLVGKDLELMKSRAYVVRKTLGGTANPFDAFLLTNGMKTLEIRMDRHCSNAEKVADFLVKHPAIDKVNYNGLKDHPDHDVAMKQMKHPGAMMSFELKKGFQGGVDFMNKLKMCTRTVSLGTCDTLLCHPASMTHFSVPKEAREKYGITDGLIRMSVGIENIEDIITDLDQALN